MTDNPSQPPVHGGEHQVLAWFGDLRDTQGEPVVRILPIQHIVSTLRNPRSDIDNDNSIDDLVASLGSDREPYLTQPPAVEQLPGANNGDTPQYRIIYGARRIRAAQQRGWQNLECRIYQQPLNPLAAHFMRVKENEHRRELHPIDRAVSLAIPWCMTNLVLMEREAAAQRILAMEQDPLQTYLALYAELRDAGFSRLRPLVTWDTVLDYLGLDMSVDQRKRITRTLNIAPDLLLKVRQFDLSAAALRSLGQMSEEDQRQLLHELETNPDIAKKMRRISRAVRDLGYSLPAAIAEVQGKVWIPGEEEGHTGDVWDPQSAQQPATTDMASSDEAGSHYQTPTAQGVSVDTETMQTITDLLTLSTDVADHLAAIRNKIGHVKTQLPEPWGEYLATALETLHDAMEDS